MDALPPGMDNVLAQIANNHPYVMLAIICVFGGASLVRSLVALLSELRQFITTWRSKKNTNDPSK